MSCGGGGNRFMCGIRRYEQHRNSVAEKPTNKELYDENNKKLQDLMNLRSQQDKGVFQPIPQFQFTGSNIIKNTLLNPNISQNTAPPNTLYSTINANRKCNMNTTNTINNVSNEIKEVSKEDRVIDFDTYLQVD